MSPLEGSGLARRVRQPSRNPGIAGLEQGINGFLEGFLKDSFKGSLWLPFKGYLTVLSGFLLFRVLRVVRRR